MFHLPISGGCFPAIVSPQGELMGEPLRSGEGDVIADLDFSLIDSRKAKMDSAEHVMCRQVEGAECASGQRDSSMIGAMASRLCSSTVM